jgi:cell division protein FtsQ
MKARNKKRRGRFFPRFLMLGSYLFGLGLLFFIGNQVEKAYDRHPIENFKHVQILTDGTHVNLSFLKTTVLENLHGNFFSARFATLRSQLLANPWIADVSIRRIWPDQLIIQIYEQQAREQWGTDAILNSSLKVIAVPPNTIPKGLPQLEGPEASEAQVFDMYQTLSKPLKQMGLTILRLQLDDRLSWSLLLSNGVQVLLGKEDALLRAMRFIHLYPNLHTAPAKQLLYVDLRYPNGFAVKWQTITNPNTAPQRGDVQS